MYYSRTPLKGHLQNKDAPALRTFFAVSQMHYFKQIYLCNKNNSLYRTLHQVRKVHGVKINYTMWVGGASIQFANLVVVAHVHAAVQHDVLASQRDNNATPTHICEHRGEGIQSAR